MLETVRRGCCACCRCCRPGGTGPSGELAERLGVTTRTIRNDVDRLRELGYPVEARPGVAGGYRLGAGGRAAAAAARRRRGGGGRVGLRTAASGSVAGIEETSVRALAKLQQVLPVAAAAPGQRLPVDDRLPMPFARARRWTRTC